MRVLLRHSIVTVDIEGMLIGKDQHSQASGGGGEEGEPGRNIAWASMEGGREERQAGGTCRNIITRRHTHGNLKARYSCPLLVVDLLFTPGLTPMLCLPCSIKRGREGRTEDDKPLGWLEHERTARGRGFRAGVHTLFELEYRHPTGAGF